MIRKAAQEDRAPILAVALASGLFEPAELELLAEVFDASFAAQAEGSAVWLADDDGRGLAAVAYYGPEAMADRCWNLFLLAVRPEHQGKGKGAALVAHVEQLLSAGAQRLLIVETAGLPEFEPQRRFYARCGYEQEGTVRDFYADGVDKVVFRKLLSTSD